MFKLLAMSKQNMALKKRNGDIGVAALNLALSLFV